jgi:hypothetical protein
MYELQDGRVYGIGSLLMEQLDLSDKVALHEHAKMQ